jgi:hypothetical protein
VPGDIDDKGGSAVVSFRPGFKEMLTGGVNADPVRGPRFMLKLKGEPYALERCICASVAGIKYPVLLELHAHREGARFDPAASCCIEHLCLHSDIDFKQVDKPVAAAALTAQVTQEALLALHEGAAGREDVHGP